jgi:hypothetical protein
LRLKKPAFAVSRFGARQIRLIPALFAGGLQTAAPRSAPIPTLACFSMKKAARGSPGFWSLLLLSQRQIFRLQGGITTFSECAGSGADFRLFTAFLCSSITKTFRVYAT